MIIVQVGTILYVTKQRPPSRIRMIMLPDGKLDTLRSRPGSAWDSQFPREGVAAILNDRDFLYPH